MRISREILIIRHFSDTFPGSRDPVPPINYGTSGIPGRILGILEDPENHQFLQKVGEESRISGIREERESDVFSRKRHFPDPFLDTFKPGEPRFRDPEVGFRVPSTAPGNRPILPEEFPEWNSGNSLRPPRSIAPSFLRPARELTRGLIYERKFVN